VSTECRQRSFGNYTPTVNSDWAHGAYKDKDDVLDVEELLQDVDEKSGEEEEEEEEVDKQPDGAQPRMGPLPSSISSPVVQFSILLV